MTGIVVHVLNRAVRRDRIFTTPRDYEAFLRIVLEAQERIPLPILAFCIMPNHWHFVVWPTDADQVSRFMHWLTSTHAVRWHAAHGSVGTGALYQGRFKSFPMQSDGHVLRACRYVERNALRAGLVARAEDWRWGSLWRRVHGDCPRLLSPGPLSLPDDWTDWVNAVETEEELAAVRRSAQRGVPFGSSTWTESTAAEWGLTSTLRRRGRPARLGPEGATINGAADSLIE